MSDTAQSTEGQVSPFGSNAWTEQAPTQPEATNPEAQTQAQGTNSEAAQASDTGNAAAVETQQATPVIPVEWLKNEFGVEDPSVLKTEREELKTLREKAQTPAEIKFENDQSKHIYQLLQEGKSSEVKQFLETQERLTQYTTAEVTEDTASEIIKLGMKLKYKDLSDSEINFKFNKEFGLPKEPVIGDNELDEDFAERKTAWQEKVNDIRTNKIIEAKLVKPELEAAKSKIVLPEISKPATAQANEPTAEQLEVQKKAAENFLTQLNSNYSKAEGFSTKVKDELVEIPISFKIPDEDKVAIKGRLEKGLDINQYMDSRWFDENNNPKIEQIITDLYQLENLDKILSGVANNSANQRLVELRKAASNIQVNGTTSQQTFSTTQNGNSQVSPFSKNAWSEQQPSTLNN